MEHGLEIAGPVNQARLGRLQNLKLSLVKLVSKEYYPRLNILYTFIQDLTLVAALYGFFKLFCSAIHLINVVFPDDPNLPAEVHSYLPFETLRALVTMLEIVILLVACSNMLMHTIKLLKLNTGGHVAKSEQ